MLRINCPLADFGTGGESNCTVPSAAVTPFTFTDVGPVGISVQTPFTVALGAALAAALFARGWLLRVRGSRAVRLTPEGEAGLQHELGVTLSTPGAEIDRGRAPAQAYRG